MSISTAQNIENNSIQEFPLNTTTITLTTTTTTITTTTTTSSHFGTEFYGT